MHFTLANVLLALVAAPAVLGSPYTRRQNNEVTCTFILAPETPVPSGTNLVGDFNFVIGNALAEATGVLILNEGATFVENPDDTFNVEDTLLANGKTHTQTAAVLMSFAGTTGVSPDGITWLFQSVNCD